jgi:hypothetical protein
MIARLLRRFDWVIERRTTREVRDDVAEELAYHVERLREDLQRRGVEGAELERRVAERFGDVGRVANECTRIALQERIMLQRINLVLLIIVGLAVAWTAWGTAQAGARSAVAIEKLTERIEGMGAGPTGMGSGARVAAAQSSSEQPMSSVSIHGPRTVGRPGVYATGPGQALTVRRALIAADFGVDHWMEAKPIHVMRLIGEGKNEIVFSLSKEEYTKPDGKDFALQAGDVVEAP